LGRIRARALARHLFDGHFRMSWSNLSNNNPTPIALLGAGAILGGLTLVLMAYFGGAGRESMLRAAPPEN
jgi:hypothetical protein